MQPKIIAIVSMDEARGIGKGGDLIKRIPEDMKRFAALTTGHSVLMGRKTFDSLPDKYRPLPNRKNIVVTRNKAALAGRADIDIIDSPTEYLKDCRSGAVTLPSEKLWIIGGAQIYELTRPYWDEVYLTLIYGKHEADTFLPQFEDRFTLMEREGKEGFAYMRYVRGV